ncbi:MAG: DNA-binding CsgD family transcriptional regulator/TolB-like protein/Tfp pilus assembly protein PilF [Hyphomicrobiaceae bacterium]|jgi:DNA-binding CsgD family transcriptional regulator/TolB-like protein/Tfp pilus assembly protein PilF
MKHPSLLGELLSKREREVATVYAHGQSYKEIARLLGISPTTVRSHLRTVYGKLGVTSKIELARSLDEATAPKHTTIRDDSALIAELSLELDKAFRRERALANVLQIISHRSDHIDAVIDEVLDHALEICEVDSGTLFEYRGDLRFRAMRSRNLPSAMTTWLDAQDVFVVEAQTGLGRVATTHQTVNIADLRAEDIYRSDSRLRRATADLGKARSFAAIPMMSGDLLLGAFTVYRTRVHPFSERALELAQLFADQSAIAIENARSRARRSTEDAGSHSAGSSSDIAGDELGKKPPQMLAILPFQAVDESDTELKIVGATLAATITMELSSSPLFRIIEQASSFSKTLGDLGPVEAAKTLGADLIASGTIRRSGSDGIRVALTLNQTASPEPIWTERFESRLSNTGSLLEHLLSRLCSTIGTGVERQMVRAAQLRHCASDSAMDHFLQGLELHHRHNTADFLEARVHFRLALDKDPDFGRAAAALAVTYVREWFWMSMHSDILDTAERHARTAMGLAPHDAWAQTVWGVVALYKRRHADAALSFSRAIELAPFDTYVVSRCALGKLYDGDFGEAEALFQRSIELDPLNTDRNHGLLGHTLFHESRYDEAIGFLNRIAQPLSWEIAWLAACYAKRGDQKQAQEAANRFRESFSASEHRYHVQTRPFRRDADMRKLRDGLRSAGLSDLWQSQPEDELADTHADARPQDSAASS